MTVAWSGTPEIPRQTDFGRQFEGFIWQQVSADGVLRVPPYAAFPLLSAMTRLSGQSEAAGVSSAALKKGYGAKRRV